VAVFGSRKNCGIEFNIPEMLSLCAAFHQGCQMAYFSIPIWVNFGVPCIGRSYILFGYLVFLMAIWHILLPIGTF
jgi:hypothetical protein